MTDLLKAKPEPPRDRWGRPLVIPPGGTQKSKRVAYMRATTLAGTLEDTYNLSRWQQRMVAEGLSAREDLLLAAAAHRGDKERLNAICEQAIEAAKGTAAATTGTALHALTDAHDRGELDLSTVPGTHRKDVEAFARATEPLGVVGIEVFGVLDPYEVAGTADRVYEYPKGSGKLFIGDTKTGSVDWGAGKIAMQLALYAHMTRYDLDTDQRDPHALDVSRDLGIVVHLPAGTGQAELLWVDIKRGWDATKLARQVREWRKLNKWLLPFDVSESDPLSELIVKADSVEALNGLWAFHSAQWTALHTDLAKARKAVLLTDAVQP